MVTFVVVYKPSQLFFWRHLQSTLLDTYTTGQIHLSRHGHIAPHELIHEPQTSISHIGIIFESDDFSKCYR
jgi:hypothetical protein